MVVVSNVIIQNRSRVNDMKCTNCDDYETNVWAWMKDHYRIFHPEVKRVDKLFTKEARRK